MPKRSLESKIKEHQKYRSQCQVRIGSGIGLLLICLVLEILLLLNTAEIWKWVLVIMVIIGGSPCWRCGAIANTIRRWQLGDKLTVGGRDAAAELTGMYSQRVGVRPADSAENSKPHRNIQPYTSVALVYCL